MHLATQVAAFWQRVKHTGLVLVFIALLMLLGLMGADISHAHQGAVPHGGLMAPGDPPVITHHIVAFGPAANNSVIHTGGMVASEGDINETAHGPQIPPDPYEVTHA